MSQFQSAPSVTQSAHPVAAETPCVVCGYSLRGLPETGLCPECGTPVERSLLGDLLRFSAPDYVARLHRGAFYVELSAAMIIFGLVSLVVLSFLVPTLSTPTPPSGRSPLDYLAQGGFFLLTVLGLLGWWLVSTPDPSAKRELPGVTARLILRIGVIAQVAGALLSLLFSTLMSMLPTSNVSLTTLVAFSMLLSLATVAAWIVSFFAAISYIRALARRVPDQDLDTLARRMRTVGAVLITAVILFYGGIFMTTYLAGPRARASQAPFIVFAVLGAVVLVVGILAIVRYIGLLDRLRRDMKAQHQLAVEIAMVDAARAAASA